MRSTPNLSLTVWDSNDDPFDSSQLAANWDAIDADYTRTRPANQVQVVTTLASVPSPVEGTLAYLSAADSGFAAGTVMRRTSSAWRPVPGVEVFSSVPSSGNFAGRLVLLNTASGSFAQWSLISYNGSAWQMANHTYEILSTVPSSGNYAGRVVLLSSADSGFSAFDLIRYTGSVWGKIGPQPIPPATELLTYSINTDVTTSNTSSPGDLLNSFSPTVFENTKYYFEVMLPWASHDAVQGGGAFLLRQSSSTIASLFFPTANAPDAGVNFFGMASFIPSAGSHTYNLYWYTPTSGTLTVWGATYSDAIIRVVKA